MASTEPKTVPPDNAARPAGNASEVSTAGSESKTKTDVPPSTTPNPTGNVSEAPKAGTEQKTDTDKSTVKPQIKTVEVTNLSVSVTKKDIWEFFNFSGDIHYIELKTESDTTQRAFVTFKDSQGAETAVLLTGATIADLSVSVCSVQNYQLPPDAPPLKEETPDTTSEAVQKAEEVVSTMLAKGFVLGKDALQKAKSFDEKHQVTTTASAKVSELDRKMGLSQKLKEVNEKYQVAEKTQSAISVAEQKANNASIALMSNPYVSSAVAAISKAVENVGTKTKEKVEIEEKERSNANANTNPNSTTVNKDPPVDSSTVKKDEVKDTSVKPSNENKKVPDK